MGNVLSLFKTQSDQFYPYLVLRTQQQEKIFHLTSQVSSLGDDIYVFDLSRTKTYWQEIARLKKEELSTVIEQNLRDSYGANTLFVFCEHPFQGLLLHKHLESKESYGCFYARSQIMQNTYRYLSWRHWFDCVHQLHQHFESENLLQKECQKLSTHLIQLERLIAGLGHRNIGEMKQIDFTDIQRRFNKFIGLLWRWTFPETFKEAEDLPLFSYAEEVDLKGFPWISIKLKETPVTVKNLDYPLSQWDHVKPELIDSFNKLSRLQPLQSPYRLLRFRWCLTLYDLEQCPLEICFKYPINMEQEKEQDFESLLTQFHFAYCELNERLKEKYQETDHVNTAYIIGWNLEVSETICPSESNRELFSQLREMDLDLENFQNKVKNKIERFQLLNVGVPGLDIAEGQIQLKNDFTVKTLCPFYLLPTPLPIVESEIKVKRFIERTASSWWQSDDPADSFRDYYIALKDKQIVYVFRDHQGGWFQHGLFS